MKKRIMVLAMCAIMVLCLLPATAMAAADTWDGTVDTSWYDTNPAATAFTITTGAQLAGLAQLVNTGDANTPGATPFDFSGVTITLGNDIDLSGHGWTPIGYFTGTTCYSFNGVFDGGGHTVSGLALGTKDSPDTSLLAYGLFGTVGLKDPNTSVPTSTVEKLNISITGIYSSKGVGFMGGLAGLAGGKITSCSVTGNITGGACTGLLAAEGNGEFKDCRVSGNVSAPYAGGLIAIIDNSTLTGCHADVSVESNFNYAGGLAGSIKHSNVTDCFATGDVTNSSSHYAGGFAAYIENDTESITGCYATGSVTSAGGSEACAGGFAGINEGAISGCYATGNVTATGAGDPVLKAYFGGFVGYNYIGSITHCFASGSVAGEDSSYIGGFIGRNRDSIGNCYASGSVTSGTGNNSDVGGLVGISDSGASITDSYARGTVSGTGTSLYQGAVTGYMTSGATCTNCYYDTRAAGALAGIGYNPDSLVTNGLATDKMTGSAASGNMSAMNFISDWTTKANDSKWYYPQLTVFAGNSNDTIKAASLKSVTFIPFTVTFDSGGGSTVTSEYGYYTAVGKPADPTHSGSVFGGWYTDSGFNTAYDFSSAVTSDIMLHAKWIPLYTVTFDVNNGSAVASQTVMSGGKITKPADPTRSGYFFEGWYKDSGLNTSYDFSTAVTADITLYAKWTKLTIASSVSDGTIYTGGRIILTPSKDGGQWSFDTNYLSCEGNTFKGLKPGKVTVTYTLNGVIAAYDVTIKESTLPSTGQDTTPVYLLAGIGLLALAAGIILGIRRRTAFNK